MAIVRVYTGDDGRSHIEDLDLLPAHLPYYEKLMLIAATSISFKKLPDGYFSDFHISPLRCFQIYMSGGQYEVGLGDAVLFEDGTGQGHTSRCKGDVVAVDVALPYPRVGGHKEFKISI